MSLSFPMSTALRAALREGYGWPRFRQDAMAAFVVSLLALPLSMALAIAVGLPPQHGLYTAVVAGFLTPLLGGARLQVSGPTAAFVVVLAPIVSTYGLHGLIWCQLMAGVFLLVFAAARLGRFISYVPYPVTTGFTAGIALILGTISLNDFFGMRLNLANGHFPEKLNVILHHLGNINPYAAAVGGVALLLIIYGPYVIRAVPSTILAMAASIGLAAWFAHIGHPVDTIASQFSYTDSLGGIHPGIPPTSPEFHLPSHKPGQWYSWPTMDEWRLYVYPALVIALLAALESLLSATIADSMTGGRHDSNAELWGIGIGNIASGFCAGIPATGALARTAALINSGGTSPLAASMHAIFILIYMVSFAPFIGHIPMPALAAILVHTAYRMSHWRQFVRMVRIAPRSDVVVLLVCFGLTVAVDMVAGVGVGFALAALLLMQRVTEMTHIQLEGHHAQGHASGAPLPKGVFLYRISGPLYFATAEKIIDQAGFLLGDIRVLIVDMVDVDFVDISGLVAVRSLVERATKRGSSVVMVCNDAVAAILRKKLENNPRVSYAASVDDAVARL